MPVIFGNTSRKHCRSAGIFSNTQYKCIYTYFWCVFSLVSNCMKICIQNMHKISENIPGHVLAEVAVSVFSFVKDSYPVSPALFEEFENNDGYKEQYLAVQDLLGLIASFTLFGKAELKVAICVNNPQPPGFTFDPTLTNGSPVKNLTAFKIIQSSFLRSGNTVICSQILRTIQMIWSWEKANFFLLEWSLQSLAQLAECVWQKSPPVHLIFFELLETVIYQLSYIPHETIRKVQAVLKQGCSEAFNVAALDCFYRLIIHSGLLSEVLSDGGLMEQLLFELKRRAKIIRKAGVKADSYERKLTNNILNVVSALALQSVRNTVFIRDLGMIPYVKIFLDVEQFRSPALCILEQLSEVNPEEYMSTAIGALCSSTESEIRLKQDLLQSIMKVLENPNSWNAFRTSGGFTGLLSIVVDMEGSLLEAPTGPWASLSRQSLVELLLLTLHTLALVVHMHPVNGHFFHTTGVCEKLGDALMQLGCFQRGVPVETDNESSNCRTFKEFVEAAKRPEPQLPPPLGDCVKLLGFLVQFATGVNLVADPCAGLHDNNDADESQRTGEPSNDDEALNHASVSFISTDSGRGCLDFHNYLLSIADQTKDSIEDNRKSLKKTMKRSFSLLKTSSDSGTVVPLHRIISLVSITSPRSFQPHKVSISPSFVEFDMTDSGYGCLFLPSLATVKGVSADFISTGGLGTGFPPSAGLSFSCWFMICRFSSACESHPVRLLTIVRHMSRAEQQFSCLSVSISAIDGCLVISTEEEPYQSLDEQIPGTLPSSVRFKCSKQLIPGQWHHLCLVMAKGIKKSCLVNVYLNATSIGTAKIKYIQPFPGQSISMDPSAVIDVCGIIGTPSLWKQHAALVWRVGPTYLFEEVLSSDQVETIYEQGTKYIGNYLALSAQGEKGCFSLMVSPERISFAINMAVSTTTTIVDIRDEYNEVDCRLIAKEMGITSRDNSTPVFLAHNISQHLSGTARTIGAALVGCFGVRTFKSYSAASSFQYIGGPAAILSLVAMASDDSSLYAAVKVLLSVLEINPVMDQEMKRTNGYKLLSFLLKMKSKLISSRIFQLIMAIVGTMELGIFTVRIPNITAFQDILCDFEVWQSAPENLDICVLNHFVEILKSPGQQNAEVMHRLNMMSKLLILLHDNSVTRRKVSVICTIIRSLLEEHFNITDIKRHKLTAYMLFKLFVALGWSQTPGRSVWIRNQLLSMLSSLIISNNSSINQEEVFFALGSDWFLLFLQGHIHTSTVLLVLTLLTHFLSYPSILAKFREGVSPGTLVETMEMPTNITDNLKSRSLSFECLSCICPGFEVLQKLLVSHIPLPQVYGAIAALLIGKSDFQVPAGQVEVTLPNCLICQNVDVDMMLQSLIDGCIDRSEGIQLCADAACVLLELIKVIITKPVTGSADGWEVHYPGSVMQFLCLVNSLFPQDPLWTSPDFLSSLASAVFPSETPEVRLLGTVPFFSFFSKMLVEKLYSGMFVVEPENLLVFMAEQIAVALERGHSNREITVSVLYKNLNRALLYFLSRPRQTPAEQELIVQTLRMLQQHWDVIMATYNANVHFIICLMHCLVLIRSGSFLEGFGCEEHFFTPLYLLLCFVLFCLSGTQVKLKALNMVVILVVESELMLLVESTWNRVMRERRQALEEAYKIDLSAKPGSKEGQVSMGDVSPLWEETAMKAWQLFIGQSLLGFFFYIVQQQLYLHISLKVHILCVPDPRILCEPTQEVEEEHSLDCQRLTFFPVLNEASPLPEDFSEQCMDTQLILKELEPTEEVTAKHCVVVISGHVVTEGVLLFGKADLYICEGFTLTSTGDVCCRIHHQTNVRDSYICNMMTKEKSSVSPNCKRWSYDDIKEANFMRFLLEVRFTEGEISNFEYLMHLNTLAGRTYNDLMQYPVFPWIIADYESETLDLSCPASFRDLSKPMGAQNEKRRDKFIQRYNEVENNDGDLSAQCHYCTHYSSAIIVASYLVRMEPFSQTFLHLQGGMFDVPERMFHSIQNEWESASKDNMSDVRELIPEFFYLPDFLVNSNQFDFGCMQDGTPLDDVVLPPWAKGDPQEFIRVHREALESDYVSARLHLWIDLIFGYKQQGPPAVEALNTFHPYFYTDKHDRASMKDPVVKSTVLGYISNFGQMPKQLFTKPHPSRTSHKGAAGKETSVSSQITPFFFKLDKLKLSAQYVTLHKPAFLLFLYKELTLGPVGQIVCREKDVLVVEKNKLLIPPHWNTYFSWGSYDQTCSFGSYTAEKVLCESLSDWGYAVCAACPNNSTIITAGTSTVVCVWDVSISKDKLKHMRLRQTLYGHTDTVTCLVASEAHSMIISGSLDQTCILWDLEDLGYITQLPEHSSAVSALAINDLTGEIVSCAGTHLYLWTMKGQLLASLNTSCRPEGNILCCCFTQKYEWDPRNVIITGSTDGIVRVRVDPRTGFSGAPPKCRIELEREYVLLFSPLFIVLL
uniref:WDFY family member 4 n=1 Tax=Cyprinus carpio TaxID=7962 RepID=A0A8C1USV3_CYPCA